METMLGHQMFLLLTSGAYTIFQRDIQDRSKSVEDPNIPLACDLDGRTRWKDMELGDESYD
jgi:hypothetical protein